MVVTSRRAQLEADEVVKLEVRSGDEISVETHERLHKGFGWRTPEQIGEIRENTPVAEGRHPDFPFR
jgi:hypothetical protein